MSEENLGHETDPTRTERLSTIVSRQRTPTPPPPRQSKKRGITLTHRMTVIEFDAAMKRIQAQQLMRDSCVAKLGSLSALADRRGLVDIESRGTSVVAVSKYLEEHLGRPEDLRGFASECYMIAAQAERLLRELQLIHSDSSECSSNSTPGTTLDDITITSIQQRRRSSDAATSGNVVVQEKMKSAGNPVDTGKCPISHSVQTSPTKSTKPQPAKRYAVTSDDEGGQVGTAAVGRPSLPLSIGDVTSPVDSVVGEALSPCSESDVPGRFEKPSGKQPQQLVTGTDLVKKLNDLYLRFGLEHTPDEDLETKLKTKSNEELTKLAKAAVSILRVQVINQAALPMLFTSASSPSAAWLGIKGPTIVSSSSVNGLGTDLDRSSEGTSPTVAPSRPLHAVQSMAQLPKTKVSTHVEEGEDDAGFNTINTYTIVGEAGRGSYGTVKIALTDTGEQRAIKVMPKRNMTARWARALRVNRLEAEGKTEAEIDSDIKAQYEAQHEIAVMKKLRHQNIVPLLEVIDDPEEDSLYLVMPFIERGALLKVTPQGTCTPLDVDVIRGYMRQLLNALHYLHERHIIHRDIKPDNILLGNDGRVYLSDFGVSEMFNAGEKEVVAARAGTPAFLAPECFSGADVVAGKPVDIWALGVTFYLMLFGHLPFQASNEAELQKLIVEGEVQTSSLVTHETASMASMAEIDVDELYAQPISLLKDMLCKNPKERATVEDCRYHPFVSRAQHRVDINHPHHRRVSPARRKQEAGKETADKAHVQPSDSPGTVYISSDEHNCAISRLCPHLLPACGMSDQDASL